VLLDSTPTLPDGTRVRLRLPHGDDLPGLQALTARLGVEADAFELRRALRFDPRSRAVACATVFTGDRELVVAYGAIDLGSDEPDTLVADVATAPGVAELLHDALVERARTRRAA
jgi:hypothetical protein